MKKVRVYGCEEVHGSITPVTSKSISNRALIINYLSNNKSTLLNLSKSDDTNVLIDLLGKFNENKNEIELNAGHAGTVMRFLITVACMSGKTVLLTGTNRMKERPINELVHTLQMMGAKIEYLEKEGFPPVKIKPSLINGGKIQINSEVSSQFISSLMLCAPYFKNETSIELIGNSVSLSYIELTKKVMNDFGADVVFEKKFIRISNKPYKTLNYSVEGDWSSASYFFSLAALSRKAEIELKGILPNSQQGDKAIKTISEGFGITCLDASNGIVIKKNNNQNLPTFNYNFNLCPDIAQTVAVLTGGLKIENVTMTGLSTLKIKETDRLSALKNELKKFNVKFINGAEDELLFDASQFNRLPNLGIETYKDHRMAMSFAVLAQKTGSIDIYDPLVVSKSYVNYWNDLNLLGCLTEFSDI